MFFSKPGQPAGDYIIARKEYALFPVKTKSEWIWKKHYYRVTRGNDLAPPDFRHLYDETIRLTEEEYLIFKLIFG